jgi:hypothetical protein
MYAIRKHIESQIDNRIGKKRFMALSLIHDFWKSRIITPGDWRKNDRIIDVEIFFNAMLKNTPPQILEKMEYVKKNIIDPHPENGSPILPEILNYWGKGRSEM